MSNNYFQFKQFNIEQQNCSMKVCTDACLLGAFAAKGISQQGSEEARVLDIGTGTGLLSLMIAQKNNSIIDAVEIEAAACSQAKQNFEDSPWGNRLNIFNTDIAAFRQEKNTTISFQTRRFMRTICCRKMKIKTGQSMIFP